MGALGRPERHLHLQGISHKETIRTTQREGPEPFKVPVSQKTKKWEMFQVNRLKGHHSHRQNNVLNRHPTGMMERSGKCDYGQDIR